MSEEKLNQKKRRSKCLGREELEHVLFRQYKVSSNKELKALAAEFIRGKNFHWIDEGSSKSFPIVCQICNRTLKSDSFERKHYPQCMKMNRSEIKACDAYKID